MAYRRLRLLILFASGILVASGVFVGCWLTLMPLDVNAEDVRPIGTVRPVDKEKLNRIPKVEDFGQSLGKRFQEAVEEPAPVPVKTPEPVASVVAAPPLDVILLGTAVESTASSSKAWLRAAGKPLRLVGVGEKLLDLPGEPELVSIQVGSVVLRVGEREQTVTMAKQVLK